MKHIQRGLVGSGSKDGNNYNIALSGFSNVNKMVVLLNGDTHPTSSSAFRGIWVKSLAVNSLVVGTTSPDVVDASYQVIEFD